MKKLFLLSAGVVFFFASDMMADPRPSRPRSESTDSVSEQVAGSNNGAAKDEVSLEKAVIAVGAGATCGYIFTHAVRASHYYGAGVGLLGAGVAYYYIKCNREEAVSNVVGEKYVGISALAAIAGALMTHNANLPTGDGN